MVMLSLPAGGGVRPADVAAMDGAGDGPIFDSAEQGNRGNVE